MLVKWCSSVHNNAKPITLQAGYCQLLTICDFWWVLLINDLDATKQRSYHRCIWRADWKLWQFSIGSFLFLYHTQTHTISLLPTDMHPWLRGDWTIWYITKCNKKGGEIPECDIDAIHYIASLLIAHTSQLAAQP